VSSQSLRCLPATSRSPQSILAALRRRQSSATDAAGACASAGQAAQQQSKSRTGNSRDIDAPLQGRTIADVTALHTHTPVLTDMTHTLPSSPRVPADTPVIPAKAGIHTP